MSYDISDLGIKRIKITVNRSVDIYYNIVINHIDMCGVTNDRWAHSTQHTAHSIQHTA